MLGRAVCAMSVLAVLAGLSSVPGQATGAPAPTPGPATAHADLAYPHLKLPDGTWAAVYGDGLATVHSGQKTMAVRIPLVSPDGDAVATQLPSRGEIVATLAAGPATPYADSEVVAVLAPGVTAPNHARGAHSLTSDGSLNDELAGLGVDRLDRIFTTVPRPDLRSLESTAEQQLDRPVLDLTNAYVLRVTGASVPDAVEMLRASPDIAYAAPNWTVGTMHTRPVPLQDEATPVAATRTLAAGAGLPTNYALSASAQSLLNPPGVNAVPAFAALDRFDRLPGEGEIITNVSLGDLTDASTVADPNDECNGFASAFGPTTIVRDGQRFLDWPSMPLIPTYTSDAAGSLDALGSTCNQDPQLVEVGLDFSVMAPLPHDRQRPDAVGSGFTDLLGVAPGADYRLVIPDTPGGAITDVAAAFVGAANQTPRPSVITASLGFGLDQFGYASRYLEEDPLMQSVVSTIVHGLGIVVCVSSGDGLRTFTNAAVSPSGGSVDTDRVGNGQQPTDLNDVAFSDAVSLVRDSGAIDVGGTTLNDIFAAPPQDPRNAALQAQHAFAASRFTGGRTYSSGVGSRVDVSAPGDNILAFVHTFGGSANAVDVVLNGGTSASAPEVAAAAAVVLQVARLVGDRRLVTRSGAADAVAVRDFLIDTGTRVPDVPQADVPLHVGPQVDVGHAVETLLERNGQRVAPGAPRVAVAQRRQASALGGTIQTDTDPAFIAQSGRLRNAWLTIAPDWTGLPDRGVTYRLAADSGPRGVVARGPWARVLPEDLLAAAGLPSVSDQTRTVSLRYTARQHDRVVAETTVNLTFGPTDGTVESVPAPIVAPVVRGDTLRVQYDVRGLTGATDPILVVSHPGRVESATGLFFRPSFTAPLTGDTGVVDVPVSRLPGAGIYGIGIQDAPGGWASRNDSAFAFTRVVPTGDTRPRVPLVGAPGSTLGHNAQIPFRGDLRLSFDVSSVKGADGARIEVSAPAPTAFNNFVTFNNPAGSVRDANGFDAGSVGFVTVNGRRGTVRLDSEEIGLAPTMNHVLRVLAAKDGRVVGRASGIVTVGMDGVVATDRGTPVLGYGVDERGGGGFLTSNQTLTDGSNLGSVETFDDAGATKPVRSTTHFYQTLSGGSVGMFADGTGLYEDFDPATGDDVFRVLRDGADIGTWDPPAGIGTPILGAVNQDTRDAAFVTTEVQQGLVTFRVLGSDVGANTFGAASDLSSALGGLGAPNVGGIGQDTVTNQAVLPFNDALNPTGPGRVVLADLDTGAVQQFPAAMTFFAGGIAVDSTTHRALIPSLDSFGVYDLQGQTANGPLTFGGGTYWHPAVDDERSLFLMQEASPPDSLGSRPNNNATSAVVVIDEQGNLVRRITGFNFFNVFLLNAGAYVQVSPADGTAYTLGPGAGQIYPFDYVTTR